MPTNTCRSRGSCGAERMGTESSVTAATDKTRRNSVIEGLLWRPAGPIRQELDVRLRVYRVA
jgi:hypothetical protein